MRRKFSSRIVSMRLSSQVLALLMAENGHDLRRMTLLLALSYFNRVKYTDEKGYRQPTCKC